jgi:hypothetical protein
MKVLSPRIHAFLDYLAVGGFFSAPYLFGFAGTSAATASQVVGGLHLTLSLLTAYPLGAIRAIPFPVHGTIELVTAFLLMALPWLMGFTGLEAARNFFVGSGIVLVGLVSITNYKATLKAEERRAQDRADKEHLPPHDIRRAA